MNVYMHRPNEPILVLHTEAISQLDDGWQYQTYDGAMHTLPSTHSLVAISGAATVTYKHSGLVGTVYVTSMQINFETEMYDTYDASADKHAELDGYISIISVIAPSFEP